MTTSPFRKIFGAALASFFLLGLTACNDIEVTFQRTSKTPNVTYVQKEIALTKQVCTSKWEYGEHHSCGMGRPEKVCREEYGVERCREREYYPKCQHEIRDCDTVPNGSVTAKVKVVFDSRADLRAGEVEKFKAALQYRDGVFTIRPGVVSSVHKYTYPASIQFRPGQTGLIQFKLR